MNTFLKDYLKINKKISDSKAIVGGGNFFLDLNPDSFLNFLLKRTKVFLKVLFFFPYEILIAYKFLLKTFKLKNSKKNKIVLILGNGPTQNLLKKNDLFNFVKNGNDLIVTNFWMMNKQYKRTIPTFYVLSDPRIWYFKKNQFKIYDEDFKKKRKNYNLSLYKYLTKHKNVNLVLNPVSINNAKKLVPNNILSFIDSDARTLWSGTCPLLPRGYLSSTVLKSISFANWLGYKKIFILGIDTTYPKTFYSNLTNDILNHEYGATNDHYVSNITKRYNTIADLLVEISSLFYDFNKFSKIKKIINLDRYSLVNCFRKICIRKKSLKNLVDEG
jgi:hypothetical protein